MSTEGQGVMVNGRYFEIELFNLIPMSNWQPLRKDYLCAKCENEGGDTKELAFVTCSGGCLRTFHVVCVALMKKEDDWKCEQCQQGASIFTVVHESISMKLTWRVGYSVLLVCRHAGMFRVQPSLEGR